MTSAHHLLGPDSPLAAAMPGYEHRQGQLDMAEAAERAIAEDRVLLCEAGTGTGKTLAYLVPAIASGRKVVVSTASKALQEQIYEKDLPLIQNYLGLRVDAVLVKGLTNYLCLRRLGELRARLGQELWPQAGQEGDEASAMRQALGVVEAWASRTATGDIAEVTELSEAHPIWRELCSSSETRIGPRCPCFERCHITRLRRAAEQADLLVVNHHLLFADLAIKGDHPGGVLPPYDVVVLDEAHRIEEIATSFFGAQVSSVGLERLLRDAERALGSGGRDRSSPAPPPLIARLGRLARQWFAELAALERFGEGRQPLPVETWVGPLREGYHQLDDALGALSGTLLTEAADEAARAVAARIETAREHLGRIVEPDRAQVAWCERRARSVSLAASPVHVGPLLRDRLFEQGHAMVLTSASLSVGSSFEFVRSRLGLEELGCAPVDELVVESALDHRRRALLYTPEDLPAVAERAFVARAARRVAELVGITGGGAFVLCTSLRNMTGFAAALRPAIEQPLLRQGDSPKSALLDRFRELGNGVLVATMSFWEGVDVPGWALRLVVMDRIPFAVPTDPLVAARCRALEQAGHSPFQSYSLPQAAITLKQGFGRLLRTRDDFGVVAVLDGRIRTRAYGRSLLASLPEVPSTTELSEVAAFWQRWVDDPRSEPCAER